MKAFISPLGKFLFLCSQKKETKEKATSCRFSPSVLASIWAVAELGLRPETVLPAYPSVAQTEGAAKEIQSQNHTNTTKIDALEGAWILACRASILSSLYVALRLKGRNFFVQ